MSQNEEKNGALIQYDGEADSVAGKNVIEAFEGNDSVIFNETYTVIGGHTEALKIHAMYDLTIMGDVTVQECMVNGSLTIIGDANITDLTCNNDFICKGSLRSEKINVGGDIIVKSINCDEIICDGNVVLQTTADINKSAKIGKTIAACEGIMGAGTFSAVNAIANEYFEFDGELEGRILELETDKTISDTVPAKDISDETEETSGAAPDTSEPCESMEEIIDSANKKLDEEYAKYPELEEHEIIDRLKKLAAVPSHDLKVLPIAEPLFTKLAEISYQDRIETVDEYLTVLTAKSVLPDAIFNYESIDHIGNTFLPQARENIAELEFAPCSIEQFSRVLSMAVEFEKERPSDWELLMDKIFEAVGLKYATVSSMIKRNKPEDKQS